MVKVFLDASVVFSAIYSKKGASREIIWLGTGGLLQTAVSYLVLEEVERNLTDKVPDKYKTYQTFMAALEPRMVEPKKHEVLSAAEYTHPKDAPIVAAAIKANPDYLTTLDRQHLIDPPEVAEKSGLTIVLPEEVVKAVRQERTGDLA